MSIDHFGALNSLLDFGLGLHCVFANQIETGPSISLEKLKYFRPKNYKLNLTIKSFIIFLIEPMLMV